MKVRRRAVLAAALALLGSAGLVWAALTGGIFVITSSAINAGGGTATGGNKLQAYSINPVGAVSMSGGPFSLKPGPLAAVRPAALGLDGAHAYPVPFKPSAGHTKITFTGLPTTVTIHIYTLSGEKVKELSKNTGATDTLVWKPVVNEAGSSLASGVYPFTIETPDLAPKKGKLMIIK